MVSSEWVWDIVSPPYCSVRDAIVEEFELYIFPFSSFSPGSINSFPVDRMPIFGFLYTSIWSYPIDASTPTTAGVISVPLVITLSPSEISSPHFLIFSKSTTSIFIPIFSFDFDWFSSVSSNGTTALAPSGTGAPVIILDAWPDEIDFLGILPAAISSITFK